MGGYETKQRRPRRVEFRCQGSDDRFAATSPNAPGPRLFSSLSFGPIDLTFGPDTAPKYPLKNSTIWVALCSNERYAALLNCIAYRD